MIFSNKRAVLKGPCKISWESEPIIQNQEEILIKVKSIGVCSSDCKTYQEFHGKYFGHEIIGEILDSADGFEKGDLVAILHQAPCMTCENCLIGSPHLCTEPIRNNVSFSKYLTVEKQAAKRSLIKLPKRINLKHFVFFDSLCCVQHAITKLNLSKKEGDILVLGNGFMAILFTYMLKHIGKRVRVYGRNNKKNEFIEKVLGLKETVFEPQKDKINFDACIDTTGSFPFIKNYIENLKPLSKLLFFSRLNGLTDKEFHLLREKEIQILFSKFAESRDLGQAILFLISNQVPFDLIIQEFNGLENLENIIIKTIDGELKRGMILVE